MIMEKHIQAIRVRIKISWQQIKARFRIERILERIKQITKRKNFFESIKTVTSCILTLTVIFGYLQWRATVKDQAANRFLDIIDKLSNLDCNSVRTGAVITMGAHLRDNYEEYRNQSIPVMLAHLTIERAPQVRSKIIDILKSEEVKPDDVVEPLIKEMRGLRLKDGYLFYPPLLEILIDYENGLLPRDEKEVHTNLYDMSKVLVSALHNRKKTNQISDLSGCILMDWSAKQRNLERANFKGAVFLRVCLEQASLREANLPRAEFYDANFAGAVLQKATLSEASLSGAILNKAELSDAILELAKLDSTDLRDANLTNANLIKADLGYANMEAATLKEAELNDALLIKANLTNAILTNADLIRAYLEEAILTGADLGQTNLTDANLTDADLTDANLTEANLDGAVIYGTLLRNAILERASLRWVNMTGAHLEGANLKAARLEKANLSRADLGGAYLTDANLAGAILKGANLEVKDIEGANLEDADLRALVLFSIDSENFQSDFDKGMVSEYLRQEFENNGFYLSQSSTLSVEKKDEEWLINDNENGKEYTIKKEERLYVYTEPNVVETELFSVDSNGTNKFQCDLDKGTILEDLRQEFEDYRICLSQNVIVSIEEENRKWLINDKDNKQTYNIRREEWLNVCIETKFSPIDIKKAKNWDKAVL
jgi:uncharacterized protein YjbI with pentapeptide repeats